MKTQINIKKVLKYTIFIVSAVILLAMLFSLYNMRDRHRWYFLDIDIEASDPVSVQAGFAALTITPEITDTWTDVKSNSRYNPGEGDTYEDLTGSGRFDAVWMAGFQNSKPARGIHDDLWARALVLDDGNTRLAWVSLDAIGLFGCDVLDIRKQLPEALGIDYAIISSTHTHSAPDLLGLWGPTRFKSGVDPVYMEKIKSTSVEAIRRAAENLRPARFRFASDKDGAVHMIQDTRKPVVVNGTIFLMQAIDAEIDTTLGTLITWDNHPETIWNRNLLISSDFPHYLREGIEKGIWYGDSLITKGLGGTAVYVTGNIGGLMTTSPSVPIACPFTDTVYTEPSFYKVQAQGLELARLSIDALRDESATEMTYGSIELRVKTFELPLDNKLFRLGAAIGLFNRGLSGWMKFRSEISYWRMGPAGFLHHPGELYPEIADGGIEAPPGQDFDITPVEIPPLRQIMPDEYKFIIGLSNDMIGYIIPKSQWDENPPFTYEYETRPYGEVNSLGPETGPLLHTALMELILRE